MPLPAKLAEPPMTTLLQPPCLPLSRRPRLSLRILLGLLLRLNLLLLFLLLLLLLPLQLSPLLLRLRHHLEKPLHPALLGTLHVLRQSSGTTPDPILTEAFFLNKELHQPLDVRCFPVEVAVGVIGRPDVWVEEKVPCVFVGPVGRDAVFVFGV